MIAAAQPEPGVNSTAPGGLPPIRSSVGSPYVINPATASNLFSSYWQLRTTYLTWDQPSLLSTIETGPALQADEPTCGCGVSFWGSSLAHSIFLTPQTSFPAYFVAESRTEVGENSPAARALVVLLFERLSASTTWKVVIDSQQQDLINKPPQETIGQPTTDASGWDIAQPVSFPGDVSALSQETAAYWELPQELEGTRSLDGFSTPVPLSAVKGTWGGA